MKKIAFVIKDDVYIDMLKNQIKKKKILNIDVLKKYSDTSMYDIVELNVMPNKEFAEFLDLGQCISRFGFPHDPYAPPERGITDELSKIALSKAREHLQMEHLDITLDDKMKEVTRKEYELKIHEIKSSTKKLSQMTTKELSAKMELEDDPVIIIAILATLFDKIHCNDVKNRWGGTSRGYHAKNGKDVINFLNGDSIEWISELWVELLPQQDAYHKHKYLKAMRTRSKNLLREKGSIWSIRFFITWLIEQDAPESESEQSNTTYKVMSQGIKIEIDDADIPFAPIGMSEGGYYVHLI